MANPWCSWLLSVRCGSWHTCSIPLAASAPLSKAKQTSRGLGWAGASAAWAQGALPPSATRATGSVIASSRVQVIQAVDGGALADIKVKEGDRVERGQILAQLEQARSAASVAEVDRRLDAAVDGQHLRNPTRAGIGQLGLEHALHARGHDNAGRRERVDTLLAATASVHGLVLVTRNVADVATLPVTVLDPWEEH